MYIILETFGCDIIAQKYYSNEIQQYKKYINSINVIINIK